MLGRSASVKDTHQAQAQGAGHARKVNVLPRVLQTVAFKRLHGAAAYGTSAHRRVDQLAKTACIWAKSILASCDSLCACASKLVAVVCVTHRLNLGFSVTAAAMRAWLSQLTSCAQSQCAHIHAAARGLCVTLTADHNVIKSPHTAARINCPSSHLEREEGVCIGLWVETIENFKLLV